MDRYGSVITQNSVLIKPDVVISPPITKEVIEAQFKAAESYRDAVRDATPPELKGELQRALWQLTFTKTETQYKVGRTAFSIFPDEVVDRLHSLQSPRIQASGLQYDTNEHGGRVFRGERVTLEVVQVPSSDTTRHFDRAILVDGKRLGTFSQDSPPMQPGTRARATITTDPPSSVNLVAENGMTLKVGQLKNYSYPDHVWKGEERSVSIAYHREARNKILALVDGEPLGILDSESAKTLGSSELNTHRQSSFKAELTSPPARTATIEINESTLFYPWEQDRMRLEYEKLAHYIVDRSHNMATTPSNLDVEYEKLVHLIVNHPDLEFSNPRDIDKAVAAIVHAKDPESRDAALMLTQSDQVREWKASLPNLEYFEQARSYVGSVWQEAREVAHEIEQQRDERSQDYGMSR